MGYLLITVFSLLNLGEGIVVKKYASKHGSGGMIMNAVIALFSFCFFLVTDKGGFTAPSAMIPLAIINSLFYAAGFYLTFVAYRCGSFGLTRLISSFSLLFTIFYGLFFLDEKASLPTYIGIALILAAMVLINYKKSEEKNPISLKWLLCITVSTVANGFIGIMTRYQQIRFDNACSNEFLIISLGGAFVLLTALGIVTDRKRLSYIMRNGMLYGATAGLFNGAKNLATVFIYLYLPLSTVSPMITGLGIFLTFLTSLVFYKEKYTKPQLVGVALGATAVILLAL